MAYIRNILYVIILLVILSFLSATTNATVTSQTFSTVNNSDTITRSGNSTEMVVTTESMPCKACDYFVNYCRNGGVCVPPKDCLKSFPLVISCKCLPPYTGSRCDELETTSNATNSTLIQTTVPLFVSDNVTSCESYAFGYCKHGEFKCIEEKTPSNDRVLFECLCSPGWTGETCEVKCTRDCGPYGSCFYDHNDQTEFCQCWRNYTGHFCEIPNVTTPMGPIITEIPMGPIITEMSVWAKVMPPVVIVLFLMLLVALYCMYKKKVELVMKIAYCFRQYEDDDGKDVDAFVSYCSDGADEQFVVHKLRPKLEQELNFKLCLCDFNDFVSGEKKVDNITNVIERSRRSILIISPRYLESAYSRTEYQQAHERMIRFKQKIIPVILEDIDGTKIGNNLSLLLKTVAYEKWPGSDNAKKEEHFWKRMLLSMPKKKAKLNDNNPANIV